jgi:hypothetical protein
MFCRVDTVHTAHIQNLPVCPDMSIDVVTITVARYNEIFSAFVMVK